jgi:hypothetical protein
VATVPAPQVQSAPQVAAVTLHQVELPLDCAQPDRTIALAQTFYVNGEYDSARRVAELCTTTLPTRAYRVIGAAACSQHDLSGAKLAYRHLDAASRQYLLYVCHRNEVTLR